MTKTHESKRTTEAHSRFTSKLEQARQKRPLKRLMEQRGRGPQNGNWANFKCPYCPGKAGVFAAQHGDRFKCFHASCKSQTSGDGAAWDEIGFLAFELGVSRKAATEQWLKEAGLWTHTRRPTLVQPHQKAKVLTTGNSASMSAAVPRTEASTRSAGDAAPPPSEKDPALSGNEAPRKSPLLAFYEQLSLSDADLTELREKRGLSEEMIAASGFRSNVRGNLAILQSLALEYEEWELVACGLWTAKEKERKPNAQYYGLGVLGKKKRLALDQLESGDYDDLEDDDIAWAWKESGQCNPLLIPYFDLSGELVGLRPHKGFPKGQKPRLYLAGGKRSVTHARRAVIVEGEFKAAALQDAVGADWAVAGVPGITQVKNFHVWGDILAWLKRIGATEPVVAFDNENKGDPKLASYQPRLEDRFDAPIWARVCAMRLDREDYSARVAHLPDVWWDANQKCDWDSALSMMRRASKTPEEIKKAFVEVLQEALPVREFARAKFFGAAEEQIIADRSAVLAYEPALPWGGESEQRLAKDLRKLAQGPLREMAGGVLLLAEAYAATRGWYYELKISEQRRERLLGELQRTERFEVDTFLRLALKGTPSLVAPFRIIPCYVLLKPDGGRDRLVKVINIRNESSGLVALDENSFTAPRDWRRWLARVGNFSWHRGETPLQSVQRDINFKLARREVTQLVCYGCERPGDLWVVDDCAFAEDETIVMPDAEGIFWHKGRGFTFLRDSENHPRGEEGQSFRLRKLPRMRPGWGLTFDKQGRLQLEEGVQDDPVALQELLGSLVSNLNESFGGFDGTMLVAATLAFMAGPEIFRRRGEFPGIWITGEKGSGKTYTARWLMAWHGFSELEAGLSFKTSSAVGAQIAMGQYANIPPWGDEYKENELREANTKGVIHGGFNRESPSKWSADGRIRTIRTNFLVTGETTCDSAATMSRFVTTVAAREKRTGSAEQQSARLEWLLDHQAYYFVIGRAVLRQRAKFAAQAMKHLSAWERLPELAQLDPRARFSYGVSYSAFQALNEIFRISTEDKCERFREWMIERTAASGREVAERVSVNQFWMDFLSALARGAFGHTPAELRRILKVVVNKKANPRLSERQLKDGAEDPRRGWTSYLLYIVPGPVIDSMRKDKRSQGQELELDRADLLAQMRVRDYFVPGPRQGHQMKFEHGSRVNRSCWCVDLDEFEDMGRRRVSDENWEKSFYRNGNPEEGLLPIDEWIDPRKGDLFAVVDALKEKDENQDH